MMLAESPRGDRILASPEASGICPFCRSEVIPKCGEIKTWHWAHKSKANCDSWGEPEGEWHYGWKKLAGLDNTEITIEKNGKRHRADIMIRGKVIELQHSTIPTYEVREREEFYDNMAWIVDGEIALLKRSPPPVEKWKSRNGRYYYKWVGKTRAWVGEITKPLYIHFHNVRPIFYYYWEPYERVDGVTIPDLKPIYKTAYRKTREDRLPDIIKEDSMVLVNGEYCNMYNKDSLVRYLFNGGKR